MFLLDYASFTFGQGGLLTGCLKVIGGGGILWGAYDVIREPMTIANHGFRRIGIGAGILVGCGIVEFIRR